MSTWTAADGTIINYQVIGSNRRPALLLLPGLLGSIQTQWRAFTETLANEYYVILMDLRGHGRSTNETSELRPDPMVQDILGLLNHLQINQVHVAGYSLGGYLGLILAQNQPRRVGSLIMHATKFYWTEKAAALVRRQLDPDKIAESVPVYADQLVQAHGGRHWRELVRQAADLVSWLVENGLKEKIVTNIYTPVLVSVGDRDEMVPLNEAYRLSRALPNGELLTLPGVRHPFQTIRPMPLLPMIQHFPRMTGK
jgi:pimeloyl-ACP methyl ester carboxylesterase